MTCAGGLGSKRYTTNCNITHASGFLSKRPNSALHSSKRPLKTRYADFRLGWDVTIGRLPFWVFFEQKPLFSRAHLKKKGAYQSLPPHKGKLSIVNQTGDMTPIPLTKLGKKNLPVTMFGEIHSLIHYVGYIYATILFGAHVPDTTD